MKKELDHQPDHLLDHLREFAEQEYPLYGSKMDDYRHFMQNDLIIRLRTLFDHIIKDEMLGYIDWLIHKGRIDEEITDEELIDQYLKNRER